MRKLIYGQVLVASSLVMGIATAVALSFGTINKDLPASAQKGAIIAGALGATGFCALVVLVARLNPNRRLTRDFDLWFSCTWAPGLPVTTVVIGGLAYVWAGSIAPHQTSNIDETMIGLACACYFFTHLLLGPALAWWTAPNATPSSAVSATIHRTS